MLVKLRIEPCQSVLLSGDGCIEIVSQFLPKVKKALARRIKAGAFCFSRISLLTSALAKGYKGISLL